MGTSFPEQRFIQHGGNIQLLVCDVNGDKYQGSEAGGSGRVRAALDTAAAIQALFNLGDGPAAFNSVAPCAVNGAKGPMQVVSGPVGRERVNFEAPAAARLEQKM